MKFLEDYLKSFTHDSYQNNSNAFRQGAAIGFPLFFTLLFNVLHLSTDGFLASVALVFIKLIANALGTLFFGYMGIKIKDWKIQIILKRKRNKYVKEQKREAGKTHRKTGT